MNHITALDRQTLFDIALQAYGRAEAAYDIALANDLPLSATLEPGQTLKLPTLAQTPDNGIVERYSLAGITPATAPSEAQLAQLNPEGISHWYINAPIPIFTISPDNP